MRRSARFAAGSIALAAIALASPLPSQSAVAGPGRDVDPFIGVDRGATFPGAAAPFGFAVPSPDTAAPSSAGYRSGAPIVGFSQTHVSGVGGGGSKYGNFRITPLSGALRTADLGSPAARERASPGLYSVLLTRDGIRAALTASRLAAVHRYTFAPRRPQHLVLDTTSVVEVPGGQSPIAARTCVRGRRSVVGWARIGGGFNGGPYRLYFALRTNRRSRRAGTFAGNRLRRRACTRTGRGRRSGAWLSFGRGRRTVVARIGLSFRSVGRARRNLARAGGFAKTRRRTAARWASVLRRLRVQGGSASERRVFYTALYHSSLMPHDLRGENAWWRSKVPYYDGYYTLWDTFRTLHPLLLLVDPRRARDMTESLVDAYRHTGWFPDARVAGRNGVTQVGSNASVVIADAAVKGLRGVDYATAYRGLVKDAERDSPRPFRHGRTLRDYKRLGYLPLGQGPAASRTLEYAHNDFAVSQVASRLGRRRAAGRYRARSRNWAKLWDPETRSIRPRRSDGSFLSPYSPDERYPTGPGRSFTPPFFEGTSRQWSTFVPHDVPGLTQRLGGDTELVRWLDELFDGDHYDPGNEPALLAPYLYHHAGRPDLTAHRVRRILASSYLPTRDGLPGEDDAGALSSWYVWSAIGLYPNAGQPFYYLGSPLFSRVRIDPAGRRRFVIERHGDGPYVNRALLNGRALGRAWLTHREVARGGRLSLFMGHNPTGWGASPRPPSPLESE